MGRRLDRAFLEAGARQARTGLRLRARMGFDANDVVERAHELYYQPDIDHLTGRSFLTPPAARSHVVLSRSPATSRNWNPLPAILDFHRELDARGIRLVVLPVPSKAVFANPSHGPILNEGYEAFLDRLRSSGVEVHDLVPLYKEMRGRDAPFPRERQPLDAGSNDPGCPGHRRRHLFMGNPPRS